MKPPLPRFVFPRALTTHRLAMRAGEPGDEARYAHLFAAAYATRANPPSEPLVAAFGRFAVEHWAEFGFGFLLMFVDGAAVGHCGLKYVEAGPQRRPQAYDDIELGYALLPDARGLGYVTEAGLAVLDAAWAAFDLERILGRCSFDNDASARALVRCGMHEIEPGEDTRRFEVRMPRRSE
jgi:RimJ/RimL family protein N-acetyltransferase